MEVSSDEDPRDCQCRTSRGGDVGPECEPGQRGDTVWIKELRRQYAFRVGLHHGVGGKRAGEGARGGIVAPILYDFCLAGWSFWRGFVERLDTRIHPLAHREVRKFHVAATRWLAIATVLLATSCTATAGSERGLTEQSSPSPERSVVSWVEGYPVYEWTSEEEYWAAFRGCLESEGFGTFNAEEPWAGERFGIKVPPGQDAALELANHRCWADIGLNPPPPATQEAARTLYNKAVAEHKCLAAEGMTMPSIPTFEQFWDDMRRHGWPKWSPYMDAKANPDYARASAACVQALG